MRREDDDEYEGASLDDHAEYLDQFLVITFEGYLRSGMRLDSKGEWVIPIGVPQEYRADDETKRALADLAEWTGWSFKVMLAREKPVVLGGE